MQREDDLQYFYARAEIELDRAQRAQDPDAVKTHTLLADYYLDRVADRERLAGHGR